MKSELEDSFMYYVRISKFPIPEREYKFCPDRRWKFDFAYPKIKLAIELEGGIWIQGRHSRGKGMLNDMEKYNWAVCDGWKILRYATNNLTNCVNDLKNFLLCSYKTI